MVQVVSGTREARSGGHVFVVLPEGFADVVEAKAAQEDRVELA